jgi:hypothetical protein
MKSRFYALATILPLVAIFILPSTTRAALPKPATCPAADSSKSSEYQAGFTFGCDKGLNFEEHYNDSAGTDAIKIDIDICNDHSSDMDVSKKITWSKGCFDGYAAGQAAYTTNINAWPASPKPDPYKKCKALQGYTDLQVAQWKADFLYTCIISYQKAINNPRLADPEVFANFVDFDDSSHDATCTSTHTGSQNHLNGCRAGYSRAHEDYENAFKAPDNPDDDIIKESVALNNCGINILGSPDAAKGIQAGCVDGHADGASGEPNNGGSQATADVRSVKQRNYKSGFIAGYNAGYLLGAKARENCTTKGSSGVPGVPCTAESGGGIVPRCNPGLAPGQPGACGLNKFVELVKNIIAYLFYVMIPIAVIGIGFGGFKIMTAAGNASKVEEGSNTIKVVVIGIIIALTGYLVVKLIFTALGVNSSVGGIF